MTQTKTTKNSRKMQTLVRQKSYELYFSRPLPGCKNKPTVLDITAINPESGAFNKVRLNGRAVSQLREVLSAQ
jgi:hypothetical protein